MEFLGRHKIYLIGFLFILKSTSSDAQSDHIISAPFNTVCYGVIKLDPAYRISSRPKKTEVAESKLVEKPISSLQPSSVPTAKLTVPPIKAKEIIEFDVD